MSDADSDIWNVDWKKLTTDLVQRLRTVVNCGTFNCGISVEDVWQDTCADFFAKPTWDPEKGPLEALLWTIAKRNLLDHIRRNRHVAGSFDDPKFPNPKAPASETDEVLGRRLRDIAKSAAGGDEEAKALIDASAQTDGAGKINQQLGDITGYPVDRIVNIKRRYLRNCGDIYERIKSSRRHSRKGH